MERRRANGAAQSIDAHWQVRRLPFNFYVRENVIFHAVGIDKNPITPKLVTDGIDLSLSHSLECRTITSSQRLEQGIVALQS
jgi:hypothetical protein